MERSFTHKIIIHCSDSKWGDKEAIKKWHENNPNVGALGYHYIILNSYPKYQNFKERRPDILVDGLIQQGIPLMEYGRHCRGCNWESVGICLIGKDIFTSNQIISLARQVRYLLEKFDLDYKDVYGHYQFNKYKTCPNINKTYLVTLLKEINNDIPNYRYRW